jgi:DNA modification methylase
MRVLDYTWNNWIRLWWLGEDRKEERGNLDLTSDVSKYRSFMRDCIEEMYRVLDEDGVAVLVVGDVKKNLSGGPEIHNTARYIAEEAVENTGFDVHEVIEDDYNVDNRGYVVFNQLKYNYDREEKEAKSKVPIDRCLVLKKGDPDLPEAPEIDWDAVEYS